MPILHILALTLAHSIKDVPANPVKLRIGARFEELVNIVGPPDAYTVRGNWKVYFYCYRNYNSIFYPEANQPGRSYYRTTTDTVVQVKGGVISDVGIFSVRGGARN